MRIAPLLLAMSGILAAAEPAPLAAFRADPATAPIPDFSFAGYHAGAELPAVVAGPVFAVTAYGAVAGDGKDDIDAIQKAVDAAAAAGGGIVTFPTGTFDFDVGTTRRCVRIRSSRIVLRGAGSGEDGTVLHDHAFSDSPEPKKKWRANEYPGFVHVGAIDAKDAVSYRPPLGATVATLGPAKRFARAVPCADAAGVKVGATFLLVQSDPDNSLAAALVAPLAVDKLAANYTGTGVDKFFQFVTVAAVTDGKIAFDAPILFDLEARWTPRLVTVPLVEEVGIEGIRFRTDWKGPFVHHKNAEHDDGWNHIRFDGVKDSWVRDTVHDGTTCALMWASAYRCIAYDCRITGPRGHNGFGLIGASTSNLLWKLDAGPSFHSYQLQANPCGNVILACGVAGGNGIDCHGGLGVFNLFDQPTGMGTQHGGSGRAFPPGTGTGTVLWNWTPRALVDEQRMPGAIVVGGDGNAATPPSLYQAQRTLRLGKPLPEATAAKR